MTTPPQPPPGELPPPKQQAGPYPPQQYTPTSDGPPQPPPTDRSWIEMDGPPRRPSRRLWIALAASAVFLVAAGVGTFLALKPTDEDAAAGRCQAAITAKLKSPATAKYGDKVDVTTQKGDFGTYYQVFGQVDAQNGFGALVRAVYHCKVTRENDGRWLVTESSVAEG